MSGRRGAVADDERTAEVRPIDTVAGIEYETDAKRFLADLREQLEKFALSLHSDKTRLIEFGRFAAERRARRVLANRRRSTF